MIKNDNNIQLNAMEESTVKAFHTVISSILEEKAFSISIGITKSAFAEKYLELDLPLKPEDGDKIDPLCVTMKNGVFYLEYFYRAECISNELGCIATNEINSNLNNLPTKCVYSQHEEGFYISAVFYNSEDIIEVTNAVLLVLEYLIILENFLKGKATDMETEQAFDAIAAGGGYVSSKIEDFNIC